MAHHQETSLLSCPDQVYVEMKRKARDAVLAMIEREREGEQIDRALLKNVLDIFIAVGMGQMETYQHDFEENLLTETAAYYKRKVGGLHREISYELESRWRKVRLISCSAGRTTSRPPTTRKLCGCSAAPGSKSRPVVRGIARVKHQYGQLR